MNNTAIIVRIAAVEKHPKGDRLQIVKIFGTQVIVDHSVSKGDVMIYFDGNLRLSPEYLKHNNLYRLAELNDDVTTKGYFDLNGRVKAIKLRGEFSDGMLMPLSSVDFTGKSMDSVVIGTEFNSWNNTLICEKYVPVTHHCKESSNKPKGKKKLRVDSPMFVQHIDTDQFFRNQHKIPAGTVCYIMEKTHGTSGRIGHVLVDTTNERGWFKRMLMKWAGINSTHSYRYIHGSRRVTFQHADKEYQPYHDPQMREIIFNKVKGLLPKGVQVYFEIYGYEVTGGPIQKGFPYGCQPGEFKVKLYRATMNNEDGIVVDYSLDHVINLARELDMEAPYIFDRYFYDGSEASMKELEKRVHDFAQGQSIEDPLTLREGVIVQFIDKNGKWDFLKYKSDTFKAFESGQKDEGIVDQEDIN